MKRFPIVQDYQTFCYFENDFSTKSYLQIKCNLYKIQRKQHKNSNSTIHRDTENSPNSRNSPEQKVQCWKEASKYPVIKEPVIGMQKRSQARGMKQNRGLQYKPMQKELRYQKYTGEKTVNLRNSGGKTRKEYAKN